jgi:hypothetical protein
MEPAGTYFLIYSYCPFALAIFLGCGVGGYVCTRNFLAGGLMLSGCIVTLLLSLIQFLNEWVVHFPVFDTKLVLIAFSLMRGGSLLLVVFGGLLALPPRSTGQSTSEYKVDENNPYRG